MKKLNCALALLACFLCAFLCGCSDHSVPSEGDGRKVVENQMKKFGGSSEGIQIKSFTKLNGQKSEINGVQYYTMDFEVVCECTQEHCSGGELSKQGDTAKHKDTMRFEKTEKGWKGPDDELY